MPVAFGASASPASLSRAMVEHLDREVLGRWFPRCLDPEGGGFHEAFDREWAAARADFKSLVFQARMTYAAALIAKTYPKHPMRPSDVAQSGLELLQNELWDTSNGGFFWDTSREGEKHVYGQAFGILAAAAVHRGTESEAALELARNAFFWLENHAYDQENGGYMEALTPGGDWMLCSGDGVETDRIGTLYGWKSTNTHLHLLEAYTELYQAWPDPRVRKRLEELLHLHIAVLPRSPGFIPRYFSPSWAPADETVSYGHDLETACLAVACADLLDGTQVGPAEEVASTLIRHSLNHGWDRRNGGFYFEGSPGRKANRKQKLWWVQAEALHLFGRFHGRGFMNEEGMADVLAKTWAFISRRILDKRHGGWFGVVSESGRTRQDRRKAHPWKAAYHETRALIEAASNLAPRGADPEAAGS